MNDLLVFSNSDFGEIRTVDIDNRIHFCGSDITKALGYANSRKALGDHCRYVTKRDVPHPQNPNKTIEMSFIPEGDVYRLITHSKLPMAEKFERWLFDDVVPDIRKHGFYATTSFIDMALHDTENTIKLLQEYHAERKASIAAQAMLKEKTIQLDENKEWYTVKRVAALNGVNWSAINWKRLKNTSAYIGREVKKVFDANYGNVNAYHIDVWKHEYGGFTYL